MGPPPPGGWAMIEAVIRAESERSETIGFIRLFRCEWQREEKGDSRVRRLQVPPEPGNLLRAGGAKLPLTVRAEKENDAAAAALLQKRTKLAFDATPEGLRSRQSRRRPRKKRPGRPCFCGGGRPAVELLDGLHTVNYPLVFDFFVSGRTNGHTRRSLHDDVNCWSLSKCPNAASCVPSHRSSRPILPPHHHPT